MILRDEWKEFLKEELESNSYKKLTLFVEKAYKNTKVFPPHDNIFRAFNLNTPQNIRVVILGQDPYHGELQANGLAFSVHDGTKIPPSLKNIFKELHSDISCEIPNSGALEKWSQQGVLLINSVLSVEEAKPNSHKNKGWEIFTNAVIEKLSLENEHIVFILWGKPSQKKALLIDSDKHLILEAPHPSPLSSYRGFFGSKPFSKTNTYLKGLGLAEIDWSLSDI